MTTVEATGIYTKETEPYKATPGHEPQSVLYGPYTAGWRTGGHCWRFRKISARVTVPEPVIEDHPDATIALFGYTENPFYLKIGVPAGDGGHVYYDYDIGMSRSDEKHIPFPLPPLKKDDEVVMEIFHNRAEHREEFTVTLNPDTAGHATACVCVPILESDIAIDDFHSDKVFYRHGGWDVYVNGPLTPLPTAHDLRLWKYHECHLMSEGGHGEKTGGIFGPSPTPPEGPWASWQEIVTSDGSPTGDVVVLPGMPWPAATQDNFGMIINPDKHPAPVSYSKATAGWRTGDEDQEFKQIIATVTVPDLAKLPDLGIPNLAADDYPDATIGLYGGSGTTHRLVLGVTGDSGPGVHPYYTFDIGTKKGEKVPFSMTLHKGDVVTMEILHDETGRGVFTIASSSNPTPEKQYVDSHDISYHYVAWESSIHDITMPLPTDDLAMWFFRDCHAISKSGTEGNVIGTWPASREIVTGNGSGTAPVVLMSRWPWPEDHRHNFRMILHRAQLAQPCCRTATRLLPELDGPPDVPDQLRRSPARCGSSGPPPSGPVRRVPMSTGRLPGIFEDHGVVGPEDDALQGMARSMRQHSTRSRRARAASQLGSQHGKLAAWQGRVEAVLDQPAGRPQASQRPPRADHVAVDVGAVAGDDVAKVLLVPERQAGEVVQGIARARLGPVDHAGDLVAVDEHVADLQVAVREHRCPRPERSLGNPAVARDHIGGKDAIRDEPLTFALEVRCDLAGAAAGPWRQRRAVQYPGGGTRCGPRRRRRGRRLAEAAQCRPWEGGEREHGRLPPQDLRSGDRRHSHRLDLDVGARLISVDLQEHVADAQGRALLMGDDDLNLLHAGQYRGRTTDVATGLSRATARLAASPRLRAA